MTEDISMENLESDIRRDYAHYVYTDRLGDVTLRQQNDVRKLYMPYTANA